ncbi:MAG: M48 family metallopeptidase [Gammaproteobacteria bacterium]
MRISLWVTVFCLSLSTALFAQSPNPEPTGTAAAATPPPAETGPVPVPEPSEKALQYHRGGNWLWLFSNLWGWLIPLVFLFTGFSARLRNVAQRVGKLWFFVIGIYFVLFSVIIWVIDLPLSYYMGFMREHAYGLSNQTFDKWFGDSLKGLLVVIVIGFLFLWVPYLLLRKSPQRWWLYSGSLIIPFLFLIILVKPIWLDPLFNDFGPMKDKALEQKILALADRAGIEGSRVLEVNKSEDTKALNAYVTGFGNTKRIVLWDTTIAKLSGPELLFIMGHEMGHYVLGHVWKLIFFMAAVILLTLYVIHRTAAWLLGKYGQRFGFTELSDIASLPLIILLFSFYLFIVSPVVLAFNRSLEHESDQFGLEITQNNRAAATAFVTLQEENLGVPRPHWLYKLWRQSHPPLGERIDFCNAYRPWENGQRLAYGHLFKQVR